jgi:hypothetical protein
MYSFWEIIGERSGKEKAAGHMICGSEGNIFEHNNEQ